MNTPAEDRALRVLNVLEAAELRRRESQGFRCCVYFLKAGDFVKIGIASSLRARVKALQTACPHPLETIGVIPVDLSSAYDVERELHEKFAGHRTHGEWFRYSDEIKAFVGTLQVGEDSDAAATHQ